MFREMDDTPGESVEDALADPTRLREMKERIGSLVAAWDARGSLEIEISPLWRYCSTDGWGIFDGGDCIASRLPYTSTVAVSGRPYRRFTMYLVQAVAAELAARGVPTVQLVPPDSAVVLTPNEFARAWRTLNEPAPPAPRKTDVL
jgi:hypothetical protein